LLRNFRQLLLQKASQQLLMCTVPIMPYLIMYEYIHWEVLCLSNADIIMLMIVWTAFWEVLDEPAVSALSVPSRMLSNFNKFIIPMSSVIRKVRQVVGSECICSR
jgi:hypothetical protein